METLLKRVQKIEEEAAERLLEVEQSGRQELSALINNEQQLMADITREATRKGQRIKAEAISIAKREINEMKQERDKSVDLVHQVAQSNRPKAVKMIEDFLSAEYL